MRPGCGRQTFLIVFDFDHTVVDCNTDEVIPSVLGRTDLQRRIIAENHITNANYGHDQPDGGAAGATTSGGNNAGTSPSPRKMQWTKLMDTLIAPFSREELVAAAQKSVYVAPGMKDVFEYLLSVQKDRDFLFPTSVDATAASQPSGSEVVPEAELSDTLAPPHYLEVNIASDSNLLFIESALDSTMPGVRQRISQIHSNPYYEVATSPELTPAEKKDEAERDAAYNRDMAERRSRLLWYDRGGNGCRFCTIKGCKPNMCKSQIIKKLLNSTQLIDPTIIFVGDGGNDYCPVLNVLRPRDLVFARRGFPLHKTLSGLGDEQTVGGCCSIGLWQDPAELLSLFRAVLEELPFQRLPTLARFCDVTDSTEFRALTLRKRMSNIVTRMIVDNSAMLTPAGRAALQQLLSSIQDNGPVPPLPGQSQPPAWIRNFAFVAETSDSNNSSSKDGASNEEVLAQRARLSRPAAELDAGEGRLANVRAAPRWGQLPWLHGEIYFQHLLWQFTMLRDTHTSSHARQSAADEATRVPLTNYLSPYDVLNPLYTQSCELARTQGMVSTHNPDIAYQDLDSTFVVTEQSATESGAIVRTVDLARDEEAAVSRVVPLHATTEPAGSGVLAPSTAALAEIFLPYRDVYEREKRDVLVSFIRGRVAPMLATRPWAAPLKFAGTLLRWMLWGNGMDLSLFSVDELREAQVAMTGAASRSTATKDGGKSANKKALSRKLAALVKLRQEESAAAAAQDTHLAGNELDALESYIVSGLLRVAPAVRRAAEADATLDDAAARKLVKALRKANPTHASFRVDIAMDNVGVEAVSDLCFGLWFIRHAQKRLDVLRRAVTAAAARTNVSKKDAAWLSATATTLEHARPAVTYHVKSHPYYVSDVTAPDFGAILAILEESFAAVAGEGPSSSAATTTATPKRSGAKTSGTAASAANKSRKLLKAALAPFIQHVRSAFSSGAFVVDADTVWTQPCEYRELPPRFINRYFYTQKCVAPSSLASSAPPNVSRALSSRRAVFTANKTDFAAKTGLIVFKGDANYRRLLGDRYWDRSDFLSSLCADRTTHPDAAESDLRTAASRYSARQQAAVGEMLLDTPEVNLVDAPSFTDVVSAFWPVAAVPVVSVRTIKSEGCVGVSGEVKQRLDAENGRGWRVNGKYGVILFAH